MDARQIKSLTGERIMNGKIRKCSLTRYIVFMVYINWNRISVPKIILLKLTTFDRFGQCIWKSKHQVFEYELSLDAPF